MGRYTGRLHKLCESASQGKLNWNQVLQYLERHSVGHAQAANPQFDSPLAPFTIPSDELRVELNTTDGPKRDETPLRVCIRTAPAWIIAALVHLEPDAAKLADSRDRIVLHWACRRSSQDEETDKIFKILITSHPESLLHRDQGGRTPLHYFLWYHAASRTVATTELFGQTLPREAFLGLQQFSEKTEGWAACFHASSDGGLPPLPEIPTPNRQTIPFNAAIVHDAKHGALALHYAVMQGASRNVVQALLKLYPLSRNLGDRQGRTPLAWYLGAGNLTDATSHICGEPNHNPNAIPWYQMPLHRGMVQLLLNSTVARTADTTGRYPLHWACHLLARSCYANPGQPCLSTKAVQLLLDHHMDALTTPDLQDKTPLHILFDVVHDQQVFEWKRLQHNQSFRANLDLVKGGGGGFDPPVELVTLLVKPPAGEEAASAAHAEDASGRLPIHAAVQVATSAEVLQVLIQAHPTSLLCAEDEHMQTPLHSAFSHPYVAPLQTQESMDLLLKAYVTSRHGTFLDGRMALKMEDAHGQYPLHYACQHQAAWNVIQLLVDKFPRAALFPNASGDVPLFCLLDPHHLFDDTHEAIEITNTSSNQSVVTATRGLLLGASLATSLGWVSPNEASFRQAQFQIHRQCMQLFLELLLSTKIDDTLANDVFRLKSAAHGMSPLHVAVAFRALTYSTLFDLLKRTPANVVTFATTAPGHAYTALDLHDLLSSSNDEWQAIRELLFAFGPLLDTHRHQADLLDACVQLIRSEVQDRKGTHLDEYRKRFSGEETPKSSDLPSSRMSDTLSQIEAPQFDLASRPQNATTPKKKKKHTFLSSKAAKKQAALSAKNVKKSIYDDDGDDLGYVVSPDNSFNDDDDSDYFSEGGVSEEEYYSDELSHDEDASFDEDGSRTIGTSAESLGTRRSRRDEATTTTNTSKGEEKKEETLAEASEAAGEAQELVLSEVAMRLWSFFVLYSDPKNPSDNYSQQVDAILDELDFASVEWLVKLPIPEYASQYMPEKYEFASKLKLKDLASPKCREVIHKAYHFLGKYDFSSESGVLIHRSGEDHSVLVRATEYLIDTEEYQEPPEDCPGVVEEEIWATGEMPPEAEGYMKSSFRLRTRGVCVKFMKEMDAYQNEVQCRMDMGVVDDADSLARNHILPLLAHYNGLDGTAKLDRRYAADTHDPRFEKLELYGGSSATASTLGEEEDRSHGSICLRDYPYAIVLPLCQDGDLFDHFLHHNIHGLQQIGQIGLEIGNSLRSMHQKGVVHGNVTMRNVTALSHQGDDGVNQRYWALTDLSFASRLHSKSSFLGGITANGLAHFATGSLPPEMFVKLSPGELKMYRKYWAAVEENYNVTVDPTVVEPQIDAATGDSYVLRCHFAPVTLTNNTESLPPLPYKLVPARESADIWSFGQLLYTLCSSGRSVFATNIRSGHLLSYSSVANWDKDSAAAKIYENVESPLAQDALFQLLSSYEERSTMTMDSILSHPFFAGLRGASGLMQRIVDDRALERASYKRRITALSARHSEEQWLKERSVEVKCYDYELQCRLERSASGMIRRLFSHDDSEAEHLALPYSFLLLPYRVSRSKSGKLTPSTKKDVEYAERLGIQLLSLSRACQFALGVRRVTSAATSPRSWSTTQVFEGLDLPKGEFGDLELEFSELAAVEVERFREDPFIVARALVQRRIRDVQVCFEDCGRVFMYLVDEYRGLPVVGVADSPFPHEVPRKMALEMVSRGLAFMHMASLYARGVASSISGVVKLIFEAAYPHVPVSWGPASMGLSNRLDSAAMLEEVGVMHEALSLMAESRQRYSRSAEDLEFMHNFLLDLDVRRTFSNLQRVTSNGASLWTTPEGAKEIQEEVSKVPFETAFASRRELEQTIQEQKEKIAQLERSLEVVNFRKENSLDVQLPIG